jgi:CheY-like chemotaxis protein
MGRSGSGLGLSVVWNTMRDHNGFIDIKSDNRGTSFHLFFPMATAGKTMTTRDDNLSGIPEGSGERLLVVDDDPVQRDVAVNILAELGYEVIACEKGEEAVEYLREKSVDLLILDMILEEGIDGKETYRRILEVQPGTRAIIVSGYALNEDARETLEMGALSFLSKPYSVSELGQAVHEALSMDIHQE